MKNPLHTIIRIIYHLLFLFVLCLAANSVFLLASGAYDSIVMLLVIGMCFFFWLWPGACTKDVRDGRIKQLWFGNIELRVFLEALIITIVYTILELAVFKNVAGSSGDFPWKKFGSQIGRAHV